MYVRAGTRNRRLILHCLACWIDTNQPWSSKLYSYCHTLLLKVAEAIVYLFTLAIECKAQTTRQIASPSQTTYHIYSRKYWRSFNLAVWLRTGCLKILAEIKFGGRPNQGRGTLCVCVHGQQCNMLKQAGSIKYQRQHVCIADRVNSCCSQLQSWRPLSRRLCLRTCLQLIAYGATPFSQQRNEHNHDHQRFFTITICAEPTS